MLLAKMMSLASLCFVTALLWQYHIVTASNMHKSIKDILETLENTDEYDIVFPVVLASGTNTPISRAKRQIESNDVLSARVHDKRDKEDARIFESGTGQELINNAGSKQHTRYVSDNTDSRIKSEVDMNKSQEPSYPVQNTYTQSEEKNGQRGTAESNSGRVENKLVAQRKITNSDGKIDNESFDTGPSVNKPDDVTIIRLKDWILEVKTNPALLVRDGLEVEWVTKGKRESVGSTEICKLQTGIVRGDVNSIVALTTCDNLPIGDSGTGDITGLIQVKGNSYFVQPVVPIEGLNHQHPHLVYRAKKNFKLQDDQDSGTATPSRQASVTNGTKNDSSGADSVLPDCPKRPKRESYWRHNTTELEFSNMTLMEQISSTEETFDLYTVEDPEENPEHSRAIFEHIRKKLEREEEVGYFLDNNLETEGKTQHTD